MPHKSLTKASVERLKPPAKGQVDYFDKGYAGFALRISYAGGKSWTLFYRIGGRQRRMKLGTFPAMSLAEAREAWKKARQDVDEGRDPAKARQRETAATDFRSVAEEWLKRDQADNRSYEDVKRTVERELISAWEGRQIGQIGRRDILDLVDGIADRGSVIMARRTQAYVHRLFKWAVGRGIIEANPASGLPKPGQERQRDRVLSDDELKAVWKGAGEIGWPFGAVIQLLILTGARRQEIAALRWSEVVTQDAAQPRERDAPPYIALSGERTKNGEPHKIPLSKPAVAIIKSLPKINGEDDFVFTITGETAISGWSRIKSDLDDDIGIEAWRLHDIRRTVATGLQRHGVGLQVIEAVLGHTSGTRSGVVGTYQRHSFDKEKAAALEAWGAHVMAVVEGKRPGKVVAMRGKR